MALVNKQEMADLLRVSLPTLSAWMRRWPDFPVEERGTNGRDYRLDATAVRDFLQAKRDEERAQQAERDEQLQQLVFPGMDPEPATPGLSLKDQRELLHIQRMRRQEAEQSRQLVPAAEITTLLTDAFVALNARLHAAIRTAGRELNLSPTAIAALDSRLTDAQREFVRETASHLAPDAASALAA